MAAPGIAEGISVDRYLSTVYRPDCDYVDGRVEERNLGQYDHARIQTLLAVWFAGHESEWRVHTVVEQRVQVTETLFRVPDICLLSRDRPVEQIIRHAPLVCIEILSPEDSFSRIQERILDYIGVGVANAWVIAPSDRTGFVCTASGWNAPSAGKFVVPRTEIHVDLAHIFADLDEA